MRRSAVILVFILFFGTVTLLILQSSDFFDRQPEVSVTLYDADADGGVDLRAFTIGESAVVWSWDRDADGSPELIAYDSAVGAEGALHRTGQLTAIDFAADDVIDFGSVPQELQTILRSPEIASELRANEGQLSLVALEVRGLVDQLRGDYDDWRLSGFRLPIVGAHLPDADRLLPGAPRAYRNGIHQGFDMYPGHVGVLTGHSGPVVAAKAGRVVHIDTDFQEMTIEEYEQAIADSKLASTTPPEILDRLRGRQIWIDHGHGIVTRYCHLSELNPELTTSISVEAGDIVGYVGNSGMEAGARGGRAGAHLHFELRVDGRYFGDGLAAAELRAAARRVFSLPEPS